MESTHSDDDEKESNQSYRKLLKEEYDTKMVEYQTEMTQKLNREFDEKLSSAIGELERKHKLHIQQLEEEQNEVRKGDYNRIKIKCLREIRNEKKEDFYNRIKEEMRDEIESNIMAELTEKIRADYMEELENGSSSFNLARECSNPQFTLALAEGAINSENSIFKQMKISCMKELEKQKKIMNYKFKERCEQMCMNIENEIESTVNERLSEELEIKTQEIRKELRLEQGKTILKEKQKLRSQMEEEFKSTMQTEWNKLNEAKNEFSRIQSKENIKFRNQAKAKKEIENFVRLKEMELQRKINELNEEINILKAQNSEFKKEKLKFANYNYRKEIRKDDKPKVNFLNKEIVDNNSKSTTRISEAKCPRKFEIVGSIERKINTIEISSNNEEPEEIEGEESEEETEINPKRALIPYRQIQKNIDQYNYEKPKVNFMKNTSLKDASMCLDNNDSQFSDKENQKSNIDLKVRNTYLVESNSRTRSLNLHINKQGSSDTANFPYNDKIHILSMRNL